MSSPLLIDRDDRGVVTSTLNRPEVKNALDAELFDALHELFRDFAESADDRVLVLTGAGDAFCSGADIVTFGAAKRHHTLDAVRDLGRIALALHEIAKPVIAKVNGVAAGAGLNLALGADLIVASDRARLSEIFARRGLSLDFGGAWLLPRLVGLHKAKELALLADMLTAEEAERMGLVNRVVPHAELDAFVDDWAGRLAEGPPLALSMSKRMLNQSTQLTFADAMEEEAKAQAINAHSEDMKEAFKAFQEKRTPSFRGR